MPLPEEVAEAEKLAREPGVNKALRHIRNKLGIPGGLGIGIIFAA